MQFGHLLLYGVVLVISFAITDNAHARGSPCAPPSGLDDCIHFFNFSQMATGMSVVGISLLPAWLSFRKYMQNKDFYVVKKIM